MSDPNQPAPVPTSSQRERLERLRWVAQRFFEGGAFLTGATGLPGALVAAAAGLTMLVIDQSAARWEAILARPIGVADAVYSVPSPPETLAWFRDAPDPPELALQFAGEIAAGDWQTLQRAHRALYDVLVFRDPALCAAFARELAARDFRAVAEQSAAVRAALATLIARPEVRSRLQVFFETLTGQGPGGDEAAARDVVERHFRDIVAVATGAPL
ncbi:hypothetical protein L6V77_12150 [Myxococcota bacterium]|nr:hypothetical protein [Myxococcota bacterium]